MNAWGGHPAAAGDRPSRATGRRWASALRPLAAFAVALLLAGCNSDAVVPTPTATVPPPREPREVQLTTDDGVTIDANLYHETNERLVILLHAYNRTSDDWNAFLRRLPLDGYASALTFDFRGHGESEETRLDTEQLVLDVQAVIDFADASGYEEIGLVGASMGGTTAIVLAAQDDRIDWVITLSAPVAFGTLDAAEAVRHLPAGRLALIAGRDDLSAADSLRQLRDAAAIGESRRAWLYEGGAHGTDLLNGEEGDAVEAHIRTLMQEWWPRPSAASR